MTAAIVPGLNHVFVGAALAVTTEVAYYTADINGSQLIWLSAFNSDAAEVQVDFKFFQKSTSTVFPISTLKIPAGETLNDTVPGFPMLVEDELRVQASKADVITLSAIVFENVSGDRG